MLEAWLAGEEQSDPYHALCGPQSNCRGETADHKSVADSEHDQFDDNVDTEEKDKQEEQDAETR